MTSSLENEVLNPERLRALRSTALLDSPPEETFDRLTRLASKLLQTPVALLSLVDSYRQFFKSEVGLGEPLVTTRETPLSHSFCKHVVHYGEPLVVDNALEHETVRSNPAVPEYGVRAYAGVPLVTTDGHSLGALCVVETQPRVWTDDEVEILRELAASVMAEIELRRIARALRQSETVHRALNQTTHDAIVSADPTGRITSWNQAAERMFGYSAEEKMGERLATLMPERYREAHERWLARAKDTDENTAIGQTMELHGLRRNGTEFPVELSISRWYVDNAAFYTGVIRDVTRRKEAEAEAARQSMWVEILQRVAVAANEAVSSESGMQACLKIVCTKTGWSLGHVFVIERMTGELRATEIWYSDEADERWFQAFREATAQQRLGTSGGLPGRAASTGASVWIEDLSSDTRFTRASAAHDAGLKSACAFPVLVGPQVVAVLEFFSRTSGPPDAVMLDVMSHVGTQLGRVVERERHAEQVRAMSVTDELTSLHNRRGFLALAEQQLELATRAKKRAHFFFADVDGLKRINDELGHQVGDSAIRDAAAILKRTFREADVVSRLAGDEFVVLAIDTGSDTDAMLARLQQNQKHHNESEKRPYEISISTGVVVFDPDRPESVDELMARGDAQMYERKRALKASLHPR